MRRLRRAVLHLRLPLQAYLQAYCAAGIFAGSRGQPPFSVAPRWTAVPGAGSACLPRLFLTTCCATTPNCLSVAACPPPCARRWRLSCLPTALTAPTPSCCASARPPACWRCVSVGVEEAGRARRGATGCMLGHNPRASHARSIHCLLCACTRLPSSPHPCPRSPALRPAPLPQATSPEERAATVEAGFSRLVHTAEWVSRQRFMTDRELRRWERLVAWKAHDASECQPARQRQRRGGHGFSACLLHGRPPCLPAQFPSPTPARSKPLLFHTPGKRAVPPSLSLHHPRRRPPHLAGPRGACAAAGEAGAVRGLCARRAEPGAPRHGQPAQQHRRRRGAGAPPAVCSCGDGRWGPAQLVSQLGGVAIAAQGALRKEGGMRPEHLLGRPQLEMLQRCACRLTPPSLQPRRPARWWWCLTAAAARPRVSPATWRCSNASQSPSTSTIR